MISVNKKIIINSSFALLSVVVISSVTTAYAAGYVPLEPLTVAAESGVSLSTYLDSAFKIGIGLAGVFAVLMIVVGGIGYISGASNPSARSEAKKKITNAIFGLVLASASWLILYTINPNLLNTDLRINAVPVTTSPAVSTIKKRVVFEQCYTQSYGSGRSRGTRTICGNTCPQGETCETKRSEVTIQYCYPQPWRSGRSSGTKTICGNTCPEGKTCTEK